MDWTIKVSYAVLLTSFTGSALHLVWKLAGWVLEKVGLISARFGMLKAVAVSFFLPIAFVLLSRKGDRREIGHGYLFAKTYGLLLTGEVFVVVWIAGMVFFLLYLFWEWWILYRKSRDLFCCGAAVDEQFEEVYRSMGGKSRRLRVYQSYRFTSPCICGVLRPKIILPVQEYSKEELRIIFIHEILHYFQGDMILKWCVLLLRAVHFFNPFVWILCRQIQKWSEYVCDFRASRALGGVKQYFQVITNIAISSSGEALAAQLMESKIELVERMEKMKKVNKNRKVKLWIKLTAVLLAGVAFTAGSMSVYAATMKSADGYEYLYHLTDHGIEEEYVPWVNEYEEYIEYGNAEGIVVRTGEVNMLNRSYASFEWTVGSGELVETESFSCKKGDTISVVMDISPENVIVKIGIILPNGNKQYIWAKDNNIVHDFSVSSSGNYKVFVENGTKTTIEAVGIYHVY